ncbi:3-oxoadipate enol-lactonase [Salinactinospora qingdaonensis]|uniref:3-oxoadipate enol-lactonase n=1 Tax=Salinactinospora qingdaonensis TaxID=702744 RepID=A0ABP7FWW9_9ACTN
MSIEVHHIVDGPPGAPVIVLSGSLGSTLDMWEPQVAALSGDFQVVRYDIRGHGESPVPPAPYSLADLGSDVLTLLDRLGVERAHFAGLSIGGMTGMWLAAHASERIDKLALLCTSPLLGPPQNWAQRAATVRAGGTEAVADAVVARWLTADYLEREPETVARMREMIATTPDEGYIGCCAAIEHMDLRDDLPTITAPTLVIAGSDDLATPPEHAETIAAGLSRPPRLEVIPGAAHLANWEQATLVNGLLREHFAD